MRDNERAQQLLGAPIKGYREHQRGHWKLLQTHQDPQTGRETGFMRYGISGGISEGTVRVWVEKDDGGRWQYRYVTLESPGRGLPSRTVVIADHRRHQDQPMPVVDESESSLAAQADV